LYDKQGSLNVGTAAWNGICRLKAAMVQWGDASSTGRLPANHHSSQQSKTQEQKKSKPPG
jgi:hypothetical protein